MHKNPFVKGKLYIKFDIVFPPDGSISPQASFRMTTPTECCNLLAEN